MNIEEWMKAHQDRCIFLWWDSEQGFIANIESTGNDEDGYGAAGSTPTEAMQASIARFEARKKEDVPESA